MATPIIPHSDYYVYALTRLDGTPFYIGKGREGRWLNHEQRAKPGKTHKDNIICGLLHAVGSVPKVKLAEGMTDEHAKQVERDMILLIGREPNGPLTNQTKGGEGDPGRVKDISTREKHSAANRRRGPLSPVTRAKIGAKQREARNRPGRLEQLQEAQLAAWLGKKHSPKTIAKMSATQQRLADERRAASVALNYSFSFMNDHNLDD